MYEGRVRLNLVTKKQERRRGADGSNLENWYLTLLLLGSIPIFARLASVIHMSPPNHL